MSSTYAIRQIEHYFRELNSFDYYYKECAINARSPENEADRLEKRFLKRLNSNSELEKVSQIREFKDKPFYVVLRRGEVMGESCLRCHSKPSNAPAELVQKYGAKRSFNRSLGEVVSAISIRIPMDQAIGYANRLSLQLAGGLLALLLMSYVLLYLFNQRFIFNPIKAVRDKAQSIASGEQKPGEEIELPTGMELRKLTQSFNTMSGKLRDQMDCLEELVDERTHELQAANQKLEQELDMKAEAEAALSKEKEHLAVTLRSIGDGVITTDIHGRVTLMNRVAEELTGWSQADALGESVEKIFQIINKHTREKCENPVHKVIETGAIEGMANDTLLITKNGSELFVADSGAPIIDASGKISGVVLVFRDETEKYVQETNLRAAKEQAEAANKAKSEFLANMSHEIRTPLNGILGMIQLMQETSLDQEQQEYVDMAYKSTRRLHRLLSDILDLSRIEANKMQIREEEFQISEVMSSVEEIFTQVAQRNGNVLRVDWDPRIPERLYGDSTRLTQILFNLVGNAAKYTRQGRVDIQAHPLPANQQPGNCRILFTVSDTGQGIPEDQLAKIFETFTQASGPTPAYARQYEGAGLGLPLVKRFVELMGGNVSIVSQEGAGTTVFVSLPFKMAKSEKQQIEKGQDGEKAPDSKAISILLADDDKVTRMLIDHMLKKQGLSVKTVENGEQAISELARHVFDCILMDVQMPVLDGVDATRKIRASQTSLKNIPIIALTAYAMSGDKEKFLAAGMNDYIAKPVDKHDLLDAIKRNLDRSFKGL